MTKIGRDALIANARAALQRDDTRAAEAHCREAIALDATDHIAWTLLGTALRYRDSVGAEAALRQAVALNADATDAQFHLGNLLRSQGHHAEAIPLYRSVLQHLPRHPSVRNNLGLALASAGQPREAEQLFRSVLAAQPAHAQALINLVHVLCARKAHPEVLATVKRYFAQQRDAPVELWIDLGVSQHALHDEHAAAMSFMRALALEPDDPVALVNLGSVLVDMGNFTSAEPVLAKAARVAPADINARALLAHARQHLCSWEALDALHEAVLQGLDADTPHRVNPFFVLSMPASPGQQQKAARRWADEIEPAASFATPFVKVTGTRLRVGYLSSDFRAHAVSFLATEVWERHDRQRISTFAYALAPSDASPIRARIQKAFETFNDVSAQDSRTIAERIRADGIDVLIDLNGYTTHARSEILAARPANLQLQWLGYLGTMGADWIDYVLTDAYVSPPEAQAFFDERFVYLPDCYCPSDTRRPIASSVPTRAQCGLPESGVVLCCFNNPYKLLPNVFETWMRVLSAAPQAVLWLSPSSDEAARNLRLQAEMHGIDPERLVFAPRVALGVHLARHAHADLYLDTYPYNAGTAANDALWMGVPVLTCSGKTMASRVAGSQLHAIGLERLIAQNLTDYEASATALASDPHELVQLRAGLEHNKFNDPLFDMARFTGELEKALIAVAIRGTPERSAASPRC